MSGADSFTKGSWLGRVGMVSGGSWLFFSFSFFSEGGRIFRVDRFSLNSISDYPRTIR